MNESKGLTDRIREHKIWSSKGSLGVAKLKGKRSFRKRLNWHISPDAMEFILGLLGIFLMVAFTIIWFFCWVWVTRLVGQSPYVLLVGVVFVLGWWLGLYCLCYLFSDSR